VIDSHANVAVMRCNRHHCWRYICSLLKSLSWHLQWWHYKEGGKKLASAFRGWLLLKRLALETNADLAATCKHLDIEAFGVPPVSMYIGQWLRPLGSVHQQLSRYRTLLPSMTRLRFLEIDPEHNSVPPYSPSILTRQFVLHQSAPLHAGFCLSTWWAVFVTRTTTICAFNCSFVRQDLIIHFYYSLFPLTNYSINYICFNTSPFFEIKRTLSNSI
jgi:hypothetical protein